MCTVYLKRKKRTVLQYSINGEAAGRKEVIVINFDYNKKGDTEFGLQMQLTILLLHATINQ